MARNKKTKKQTYGVKIIAHRGNGPTSKFSGAPEHLRSSLAAGATVPKEIADVPPEYAPENTVKAFRKAMAQKADGIELDVYLSKDGVPMVCHDAELNLNVRGANRAAKTPSDPGYLGKIGDYTAAELQQFDMGQGEKMPTLAAVVDIVAKHNRERASAGKEPLILNVEFKTAGEVVDKTAELLKKHRAAIPPSSVIYCSFAHDALRRLKSIDSTAQIAPALTTDALFGKENIKPGWIVDKDKSYQTSALRYMDHVIEKDGAAGLDAVLFDVDPKLVDVAKKHHVPVHASTSDFRDFSDPKIIDFLVDMSREVPVFFKTDEPGKVRQLIAETEQKIGPSPKLERLAKPVKESPKVVSATAPHPQVKSPARAIPAASNQPILATPEVHASPQQLQKRLEAPQSASAHEKPSSHQAASTSSTGVSLPNVGLIEQIYLAMTVYYAGKKVFNAIKDKFYDMVDTTATTKELEDKSKELKEIMRVDKNIAGLQHNLAEIQAAAAARTNYAYDNLRLKDHVAELLAADTSSVDRRRLLNISKAKPENLNARYKEAKEISQAIHKLSKAIDEQATNFKELQEAQKNIKQGVGRNRLDRLIAQAKEIEKNIKMLNEVVKSIEKSEAPKKLPRTVSRESFSREQTAFATSSSSLTCPVPPAALPSPRKDVGKIGR